MERWIQEPYHIKEIVFEVIINGWKPLSIAGELYFSSCATSKGQGVSPNSDSKLLRILDPHMRLFLRKCVLFSHVDMSKCSNYLQSLPWCRRQETLKMNICPFCILGPYKRRNKHFVKSARIRSFSGPYFPSNLSVFSPNAGKYGPEKLRIRTLFTQWKVIDVNFLMYFNDVKFPKYLKNLPLKIAVLFKRIIWPLFYQFYTDVILSQFFLSLKNDGCVPASMWQYFWICFCYILMYVLWSSAGSIGIVAGISFWCCTRIS